VQPLHSGVASRRFEGVKLLVEAGAPINEPQQEGWRPLHEAANRGDLELAKYLLAHGADPKVQNDAGKSAIGLAADKDNAAMLKLLKGVKT